MRFLGSNFTQNALLLDILCNGSAVAEYTEQQ